jgi:hypothetical protein
LQEYEARLADKQRADALSIPEGLAVPRDFYKCESPGCACQNNPDFKENPMKTLRVEKDTAPDMDAAFDCAEASAKATTQLIDDLTTQLESERATVIETKELLAKTEDLLLKQTSYCEVLGKEYYEQSENMTSLFGRNIELLAEIDELKAELEQSHTQEEKCYKTIAVLLNQKYEAEGALKFAGELLASLYAQG